MHEDDKNISDQEYYRRNFTSDYDLKDDDDIDWIDMMKFAIPIIIMAAAILMMFVEDDEDYDSGSSYNGASSTYIYSTGGGYSTAPASRGFRSRSGARSGGFSSGKN